MVYGKQFSFTIGVNTNKDAKKHLLLLFLRDRLIKYNIDGIKHQ